MRRGTWEIPRDETLSEVQQLEGVAVPADAPATEKRHLLSGLRSRLLALTTGFVLFATLLIYPVLAGTFRNSWLLQRARPQGAALAVEAAPDGRVSDELSVQLLTRRRSSLSLCRNRNSANRSLRHPST